jgi:hypothetical protein
VLAIAAPLPFVRTVEAVPTGHAPGGLAAEPFSETGLPGSAPKGRPSFSISPPTGA